MDLNEESIENEFGSNETDENPADGPAR